MNGNKFATGQILKKPVEVVKERILAGWAQKSPESLAGARPGTRTPTGHREIATHQNDAKPKFATIFVKHHFTEASFTKANETKESTQITATK